MMEAEQEAARRVRQGKEGMHHDDESVTRGECAMEEKRDGDEVKFLPAKLDEGGKLSCSEPG